MIGGDGGKEIIVVHGLVFAQCVVIQYFPG